MSIDIQHNKIVFVCDGCGDGFETGKSEFAGAVEALRRSDWRSAKDGDTWKHFCDDCKGDTRLRLQ